MSFREEKAPPLPSLGKSTSWNFLGSVIPMIAGLVAIPLIIQGLGVERFGLLTLSWLVLGYFSLFDLGLGRALTKVVAEARGVSKDTDIFSLFWISILLMVLAGLVGALLMFSMSGFLVSVLSITPSYQPEAESVFRLLACSLPVVIVASGLRGMLEAYHQFRRINLIKIPIGLAGYILPVALLVIENSLTLVVAGNIFLRVVLIFLYSIPIQNILRLLPKPRSLRLSLWRRLTSFGGWMTVTNIVGPLMVYMDGFVIGTVLSTAVIAYYSVPFEVASKLLILPAAIISALFPLLAQQLFSDRVQAVRVFSRSSTILISVLLPLVTFLVSYSHELLSFWLGEDFADSSYLIARFLVIGVFVNCMAQFPFALLQSAGYPKQTALLHLLELPMYLFLLICLMRYFGIEGAAIAWMIRVILDGSALIFLAYRRLPDFRKILLTLLTSCGICVCMLLVLLAVDSGLVLVIACGIAAFLSVTNLKRELYAFQARENL